MPPVMDSSPLPEVAPCTVDQLYLFERLSWPHGDKPASYLYLLSSCCLDSSQLSAIPFLFWIFFFLRFIYLMSALGLPLGAWTLRCCTQAFSSYNERDSGVVRASHCRGFSLQSTDFRARELRSCSMQT